MRHIKKDKNSSPFIGQLYYFKVHFKKGINTIYHNYIFNGDESVAFNYSLTYILETAKRWKGRAIKDFTFKVDMGKNAKFYLGASHSLQNPTNWHYKEGKTKSVTFKNDNLPIGGTFLYFNLKDGKAVFHKKTLFQTI